MSIMADPAPAHLGAASDEGIQLGPITASTDVLSATDGVVLGKTMTPNASPSHGRIPNPSLLPTGSIQCVRTGKTFQVQQLRLRNDLLFAVGFLELANAGDFAANVWNEIPVPIYAAVLMGIGGTAALGMVYFAVKDAMLSWNNSVALSAERRLLRAQLAATNDQKLQRTIHVVLDMNFRELGTETVDRIGMDVCMGFGALVVGVGTLMAIAGANPVIFNASNLLSGYIGNAPCALYGLINLLWSVFVWQRARSQYRSGSGADKACACGPIREMIKTRIMTFQLHSMLNGTVGVVAGAASLISATMWWGYIILAPCIVMSALTNLLWRKRVGYNRPLFQHGLGVIDEESIIAELHYINKLRHRGSMGGSHQLSNFVSDSESSAAIMGFLTRNGLFERFCEKLLMDEKLVAELFGSDPPQTLSIRPTDLIFAAGSTQNEMCVQVAQNWFTKMGSKCFDDRERYLAELLGTLFRLKQQNRSE